MMVQGRRLAWLEGKVNTIARAISWVLSFVVGFGVYFLTTGDKLATYCGIGAALIAGGAFEWHMRYLEKLLPDDTDEPN